MSGFSNTDSESLARIAEALEGLVIAEQRRNELLVLDQAERKAAWRESEERSSAALERLLDSEPPTFASPVPVDPAREFPEHAR